MPVACGDGLYLTISINLTLLLHQLCKEISFFFKLKTNCYVFTENQIYFHINKSSHIFFEQRFIMKLYREIIRWLFQASFIGTVQTKLLIIFYQLLLFLFICLQSCNRISFTLDITQITSITQIHIIFIVSHFYFSIFHLTHYVFVHN